MTIIGSIMHLYRVLYLFTFIVTKVSMSVVLLFKLPLTNKYCRWWVNCRTSAWQPKFIIIQRLKIYSDVQKSSVKPEPKLTSDLQPIAPTSRPTIGNTLVTYRISSANRSSNCQKRNRVLG